MAKNGPNGARDLHHLLVTLLQSQVDGPPCLVKLRYYDSPPSKFLADANAMPSAQEPLFRDVLRSSKHGPRFWKVFRSLDSLKVDKAQAQGQDYDWGAAKSWLCSRSLKSVKYICSRTSSVSEDEFHEIVLDIKAAIAAAEKRRNHYALPPDNNYHDAHDSHDAHDVFEEEANDDDNGQDGHEEVQAEDREDEEEDDHKFDYEEDDMKSNRGLIPEKNLHTVETDEDLGYIIHNMDTLRQLCVPRVSWYTYP
ncbi:hypothetical protein MVEG_03190 [Podila verticillata NRRL 6337]|nr:hypothetical protein MVEG_03190 [Podila verticillata NRRL 6337]